MMYSLNIQGHHLTCSLPTAPNIINGKPYWYYKVVGEALEMGHPNVYTLIDPAFTLYAPTDIERPLSKQKLFISTEGILYLLLRTRKEHFLPLKAVLCDCMVKGTPIVIKGETINE